jgi:hypothetical protein
VLAVRLQTAGPQVPTRDHLVISILSVWLTVFQSENARDKPNPIHTQKSSALVAIVVFPGTELVMGHGTEIDAMIVDDVTT